MCGKIFWKGSGVFVVTFTLGVLVSSLFIPKECTAPTVNPLPVMKTAPAQNSTLNIAPAPLENKNCVPVDGKLKYETLENKALPDSSFKFDKAPKSEVIKPENKKKSSKSEKEKQFDFSNDSAKVSDLLHREKCFETREQK